MKMRARHSVSAAGLLSVACILCLSAGTSWGTPQVPLLTPEQAAAKAESIAREKAQTEAEDKANEDKFFKLYPGVLTDREKDLVEELYAENRAVSERGPVDEQEIHKTRMNRAALLNLMKREFAVRHITDWMGDSGWLYNIRWSIMDRRAHQAYGKTALLNPEAEHYLDRVPYMKGKYVNTHGLTGDIALVKSYVYDKYVRDGEFFVDLVWWIETIEGDIFAEGGATVRLPSRGGSVQ